MFVSSCLPSSKVRNICLAISYFHIKVLFHCPFPFLFKYFELLICNFSELFLLAFNRKTCFLPSFYLPFLVYIHFQCWLLYHQNVAEFLLTFFFQNMKNTLKLSDFIYSFNKYVVEIFNEQLMHSFFVLTFDSVVDFIWIQWFLKLNRAECEVYELPSSLGGHL